MKTNINIIKKMAKLGILDTEPVKSRKEDDIIIINDIDKERKVILDGITDEDLPMLISLKQFEVLKSIKSMVKFLVGSVVVGALIWLFFFLSEVGISL